MREQRKEHRIKASIPIVIFLGREDVQALTGNISRLGAYFEIEREISVGLQFRVELDIPAYTQDSDSSGKLACKSTVFRCNLVGKKDAKDIYGIGVFFTEFDSAQDKEKLSGYIDFLIAQEALQIQEGVRRHKQDSPRNFQKQVLFALQDITQRLDRLEALVRKKA